MQQLTIEQAADYLEDADLVEEPIRISHAIINVGITAAGRRFVMMVDGRGYGNACISEGM
ncbi:hypothetical protein [Cupriavidus pauculus]|uniref:hypothetical protein n=1 Tax=Cupriavidus pauculus TaxID=82633 RepID=UPI001244F8C3|nr:hypothetical protein [Cupriavidus pauculus]KAB0597395.1 hypothetical protein F7R19_26445 [Cupriavidus pauculus]MCM3606424.1 hypothetical protein [Cupriavidus pauculus]UAL00516.1 hypothetical protein K8O84_03915 [Cupriavidus pauculus]